MKRFTQLANKMMVSQKVNIALVGAGWWSQTHHLKQLSRNEDVNIASIVKRSLEASGEDQDSLPELAKKYDSSYFQDVKDMLKDKAAKDLDGVIVATPHTTHYSIGEVLLKEAKRRLENNEKPLHIFMEKPITADIEDAQKFHQLVTDYQKQGGKGSFIVNHSANFRDQAKKANEIVASGQIGDVKHISGFFASPLMDLFDDPSNKGWTKPSGSMRNNGFGWGQQAHLLGWIFHACPELLPKEVYCKMTKSANSGADLADAATITCEDQAGSDVIMSISGTAMLPGGAHSDPPTGKLIQIMIFGTKGALLYAGDDRDPESGKLELRRFETDGDIETPAGKEFEFENIKEDGKGPESLQNFVKACKGEEYYNGADSMLGLKTIQVLEAMYRSDDTHKPEAVKESENPAEEIADKMASLLETTTKLV